VGDAFGSSIFLADNPNFLRRPRPLPTAPWRYTDDSVMAMGIVEVLQKHVRIDQDELASIFGRRYWADTNRGYGPNIGTIFEAIRRGVPWPTAATAPVRSQRSAGLLAQLASWLGLQPKPAMSHGSLGNGGAMRVAPVGGYFADDMAAVVGQAGASAG
jgi:ADP-ribosylglycohydrolase